MNVLEWAAPNLIDFAIIALWIFIGWNLSGIWKDLWELLKIWMGERVSERAKERERERIAKQASTQTGPPASTPFAVRIMIPDELILRHNIRSALTSLIERYEKEHSQRPEDVVEYLNRALQEFEDYWAKLDRERKLRNDHAEFIREYDL